MNTVHDGFDVCVVGAGVVGCAIASAGARQGYRVLLLERHAREGQGISSRNSGVIHSGLYYPTGSLKAELCVRGQGLLYEWLENYGVPYRRTGKLVVARDDEEMQALDALYENAKANNAPEISLVGGRMLRSLEPELPAVRAALFCEHSGVVDAIELNRSLLRDARQHGAEFVANAQLTAAERRAGGFWLETKRGPIMAMQVVNAAGLYADHVAALFGSRVPTIYPCRGDYFRVLLERSYSRLIYPVRKANAPGLGIHLTIDLSGGLRIGPDVEYVPSREDMSPADWKSKMFKAATEDLLGPVRSIHWDGCGIRPKLRGPNDVAERDFELLEDEGVIHLVGIESPGLTACLALAERVVARL